MKNLIVVFVLSFFSNVLLAHGFYERSYNSDLNIKMWDNSSFIITIDNGHPRKTRNFNLKNIEPGNHFVKIVKKKRNHYHYGHGHPNHNGGGFVETIFKGNIKVPAKRNVFVKIKGKNRLSFKFFKKNHNQHGNGHGHNNQHNNSPGSHYGSLNHNDDWNYGCQPINNYASQNNHNGQYYESMSMSGNSFNELVRLMNKEHFDDDRLEIARQVISSNNMDAKQVARVLEQFTFDSSKLEFAKIAYRNTIDKENYFVVNSKFTFSSSVSDLNNFIRHTNA